MTDKNEEQKRLIWRIKNQPERYPEARRRPDGDGVPARPELRKDELLLILDYMTRNGTD